jgi:two-component system cell cycle sensor histidine kinase/response regulator CckA
VLAAAQRSSQVTRQLLAFARRRVMSVRATDLNRVVLDARALLAPLLGAHVEIRLTTAPNLPAVSLDPAQFEQVIVNLALNARDAMPEGGTLRLETSLQRVTRSDPLGARGVTPGTYAVVTVADTGHGMPADILARAFEPFFTTKPVGSGTGLGLSMVYGTMQQHGGTVLVDSAPGAGTTFRLLLPVRADATPVGDGSPEAMPTLAPAADGRGEAVLLVEDEAPVRALLARVLRRRGYRVAEASNGADALERIRAGAYPDLAVLITDLVMPRLGGVALARSVRADHPHLPILLMSGYSRDGVPEDLLADPAIRFLEKPLQADALLHAVRSLVDAAPTGAPR